MNEIKEGQKAPDFVAPDQEGNLISLNQFTGKKVVLYFYPKDDTPGCTAEACSFRDNYAELIERGIVVLGVSADNEKSHLKFVIKHNLPFKLLADIDKKIVNDYGVWIEKNMYGKKYMGINRKTFVIDENGIISNIIEKVETKNSATQVLKLLS